MKFISEALANWQVERLEALIVHARHRVKANKLRGRSLVGEHLNMADEHLDEAISAMKYKKFEQASHACQAGFVQAGFAELLLEYGPKIDNGLRKVQFLTGAKERVPEEEELAAFLASTLADMKMCIEYSNCTVSERSHSVLDRAMDYYNDALKAIKSAEAEKAKHCAQAGLLSILLASELIGAENGTALAGWRGLSNPMLVSPLRKAGELVSLLAETRQRLHEKEDAKDQNFEESEKNILLRKHWEKAYNDFQMAVMSLATGTVSHAQSLLKGAFREMDVCLDIIGTEDPDRLKEEYESDSAERVSVIDAVKAVSEIKDILTATKLQRKDYVLTSLDRLSRHYKTAIRCYEKEQFDRAGKATSDALLELDLVRQQIHFKKAKFTKTHSNIRQDEES